MDNSGPSLAHRALVLGLIGAVLVACSSPLGNNATSRAIASSPSVRANLAMRGSLTADFSTVRVYGQCGHSRGQADFSAVLLVPINGTTYSIILLVPHYVGPGRYPIGEAKTSALINLGKFVLGESTPSASAVAPGELLINPDGRSGFVNAPNIPVGPPIADRGTVSVVGNWQCP